MRKRRAEFYGVTPKSPTYFGGKELSPGGLWKAVHICENNQ